MQLMNLKCGHNFVTKATFVITTLQKLLTDLHVLAGPCIL